VRQNNSVLRLLDFCLHVIHITLILFFLFGWLFESTRSAHMVVALLMFVSWYGLGLFFEMGYCLITDLQWKVKRRLNEEPETKYYVKYMVDKITGLDSNPVFINRMSVSVFFVVLALSGLVLAVDYLRG